MVDLTKLCEGDHVEIALTDDAVFLKDALVDRYVRGGTHETEKREPEPGRYRTGYFFYFCNDTVFLYSGWDKARNCPVFDSEQIGFAAEVIKYYRRKRKPDWTETVRK